MPAFKDFNPTSESVEQCYKWLIGAVVPRPIAVVSTLSTNQTPNVAPFSFFMGVSSRPMLLAFAISIRGSDGLVKDTLRNLKNTKECVINTCSEEIITQVNLCAKELPYGESEFLYSKLTAIPSIKVAPPRIAESPIQFECKVRDLHFYGDEVGSSTLAVVEVLHLHIRESLLMEGNKIDQNLYHSVGRGAGSDWVKTRDRLQIQRV